MGVLGIRGLLHETSRKGLLTDPTPESQTVGSPGIIIHACFYIANLPCHVQVRVCLDPSQIHAIAEGSFSVDDSPQSPWHGSCTIAAPITSTLQSSRLGISCHDNLLQLMCSSEPLLSRKYLHFARATRVYASMKY